MHKITLRTRALAGFAISFSLATGCIAPKSGMSSALLSTSSSQSQMNTGDPGSTDPNTFQVVPAGSNFSLTGLTSASMNLGAATDQAYTLHTGAYSGSIRLTVEDDEIQAIDTKSQIAFTITPSVIAVAANSSYNFTVHSVATQAAPDLALHYHVIARDAAGAVRKESQMVTDFAVNPVFEITIGTGNALNTVLWSTDLVNAGTGVAAKQPVNLIAHKNGVTLRFSNMDVKGPHIIHGSGLIPHQNTSTSIRSLAAGAVNPAGKTYVDSYDVKVTSTTASGSGTYYLHDAESGAKAGKVTFNANAATVHPPVIDPTATYTKLASTILQTKCVSCHSAGNPSGGFDLSSFNATLKTAVPYDAVSSSLYSSVLANMPLGGNALSSTELDLIKNWINNGAMNN
jgi:hypothetical protein